ncbi:MAG: hypothetical protein HZB25_05315 [Candidatus Eisenbacteria bacterium]|nr:hypothetical protein [Candidatus Eisenbacteria bacterium]
MIRSLSKVRGRRGTPRGRIAAALLAGVLAVFAGCSKDVTPPNVTAPVVNDLTVVPRARLEVGDHLIRVSWTVDDTTRISTYRVFRSTTATGGYTLLSTTATRSYTDRTAQYSTTYFYQVVSVLTDSRLSQASTAVSGTPNLYSIAINGGQPRTRVLTLSLQLSAPPDTRYTQISERADFAGAPWDVFQSARSYAIQAGDGSRTLWARFRDRDGNDSEPVFATVILDTQAFVDSVQASPAGGVHAPGSVVHFRVRTRGAETGGNATVDLGQRLVAIALSDQGVNGDTRPGDGIYELDYILPRGFDVLRVPVTGHFTDAAGNRAPDLPADSLFTLHTPPSAVSLVSVSPAADENSTALDLTWTPNNEAGFASYQVFRGDGAAGLPAASSYSRLTTIPARATVTFTDGTAREGQRYAYRVDVLDSLGYAAQGAPLLATARSQGAVTLNPPVPGQGPDSLNVVLTWSQSNDPIFASYAVMRAEGADTIVAPSDGAFLSVSSITTKGTLSYVDVTPRENTAFWYRVDEVGNTGIRHPSRPRAYLTLNAAPPAVALSPPFEAVDGKVSLSWTRSTAKDFTSYRVYRAQGAGADTTIGTLVFRTLSAGSLTAVDSVGLLGGTQYWYRTWVTDNRGLATASTEQTYTTHSQPPPAVSILGSTSAGPGVGINWSQSTIQDFESYRVYRSRDVSVNNGSVLAGTVTDKRSTSIFENFGHIAGADSLKPNTDYYYRVYVYNKGGLSTGSSPLLVRTPAWSTSPVRPAALKPRPPALPTRR